MIDMETEGKTKTGQLDFKMAAAACYVPVSFLHVVAAAVWLLTEPKESRFVRFHAVQSLILFGVLFGGAMVSLIGGMILIPLVVMVLGTALAVGLSGVSDDLGQLVSMGAALLSSVSYLGGALLGILLSLGFPVAFVGTLLMVVSGKQGRWPVIGNLALRFV